MGPCALDVGVVRSPHHAVETDVVAGVGLGAGHEARPDEAVPLPVLGRRELEHGPALRAQVAVEGAVEVTEGAGDPVGEQLRERELEAGMAVEHTGPHEPPQVPGAEEERLGEGEKDVGDVPERVVLGRDRVDAVGVERHVVLLAHRPQRLVDLVVQARVLARGRHAREGDPPAQAVLGGPFDLLHGRVDVLDLDLSDAEEAVRIGGAEVGQPAVVDAGAGDPLLDRRLREPDGGSLAVLGAERAGAVREDDAADHAVGLLVPGLHLGISGAGPEALLLLERVHLVGLALGLPNTGVIAEGVAGVEFGLERRHVLLVDVRGVVVESGAGVGVRRDHH